MDPFNGNKRYFTQQSFSSTHFLFLNCLCGRYFLGFADFQWKIPTFADNVWHCMEDCFPDSKLFSFCFHFLLSSLCCASKLKSSVLQGNHFRFWHPTSPVGFDNFSWGDFHYIFPWLEWTKRLDDETSERTSALFSTFEYCMNQFHKTSIMLLSDKWKWRK